MVCPVCGSSRATEENGCDLCGYYFTAGEKARHQEHLLAKVRAARNRSQAAIEWGGVEMGEPRR